MKVSIKKHQGKQLWGRKLTIEVPKITLCGTHQGGAAPLCSNLTLLTMGRYKSQRATEAWQESVCLRVNKTGGVSAATKGAEGTQQLDPERQAFREQ